MTAKTVRQDLEVGDLVELQVLRGGTLITIHAKVEQRSSKRAAVRIFGDVTVWRPFARLKLVSRGAPP